MYERIIVPLDGSFLAERALPHADAVARSMSAPLHLVQVVDPSRIESFGISGLSLDLAALVRATDEERKAAQCYLASVADELIASGLKVTYEVRRGLVGQELAAAIRPHDLVVMTTRGKGGAARRYLGSTAEVLTHRSPAPVMLIRIESAPPQARRVHQLATV